MEWCEKDLHLEIEIQLSRVLKSREARASDVKTVFAVVGGDHGDMAFQYGVAITAELQDGEQLYFEVSCCQLICRKDTSALLEKTILSHLTTELRIISTQALNIYSNANDTLLCTNYSQRLHHWQPCIPSYDNGERGNVRTALFDVSVK